MKVTKGTITRTILTGIVVVNMVLQATGHDVIKTDDASVSTLVESVVQIGVIVSSFWYNNSFSENAKRADEYMKNLNEGE